MKVMIPFMMFMLGGALVAGQASAQSGASQECRLTEPARGTSTTFPCTVLNEKNSNRIAMMVNDNNNETYRIYAPGSQESGRQGAWVNLDGSANCAKLNDGYPPESDDPYICAF